MRDPFISVREDVHPAAVCSSCHAREDLVEIRIGSIVHDVCRECFGKLGELVQPPAPEVERKLETALKMADMFEKLYRTLYMSSEQGEDMQSTVAALSDLWELLGVDNQTQAIHELEALKILKSVIAASGTTTGRFSCAKPNMEEVPRK